MSGRRSENPTAGVFKLERSLHYRRKYDLLSAGHADLGVALRGMMSLEPNEDPSEGKEDQNHQKHSPAYRLPVEVLVKPSTFIEEPVEFRLRSGIASFNRSAFETPTLG